MDQLNGELSDMEQAEGFDPKRPSADYKLLKKLAEGRAKSKFYATGSSPSGWAVLFQPRWGPKVFEFGLGIAWH